MMPKRSYFGQEGIPAAVAHKARYPMRSHNHIQLYHNMSNDPYGFTGAYADMMESMAEAQQLIVIAGWIFEPDVHLPYYGALRSGLQAQAQKDWRQALDAYKAIPGNSPQKSYANFLSLLIYYQQGNLEAVHFLQSRLHRTESYFFQLAEIVLLFNDARYEQAAEKIQHYLKQDNLNADAWALAGDLKYQQEGYLQAYQDYQTALRLDADNGPALVGLIRLGIHCAVKMRETLGIDGHVYYRQLRKQALRYLDHFPNDTVMLAELACLAKQFGDYALARQLIIDAYRAGFEADYLAKHYACEFAEIEWTYFNTEMMKHSGARSAWRVENQAMIAEIKRHLIDCSYLQDSRIEIRYYLASMYEKLGELEHFEIEACNGLQIDPYHAGLLHLLLAYYLRQENYLAAYPLSFRLSLLGEIDATHADLEKMSGRITAVQQRREIQDETRRYQYYLAMGREDSKLELLRQCAVQFPLNADIHQKLAIAYQTQNRYELAGIHWANFLKLSSRYEQPQQQAMRLLLRWQAQGVYKPDESLSTLQSCLCPVNHYLNFARFHHWLIEQQPSIGERLYQKAMEQPDLTIAILIWEGSRFNEYDTFARAYFQKLHALYAPDKPFPSNLQVQYASVSKWFTSHHQKYIVADVEGELVSFIGGSDIAKGRFDWAEHPINNTRANNSVLYHSFLSRHGYENHRAVLKEEARPMPRLAWRDVQARLQGVAAHDLLTEFIARWRCGFDNMVFNDQLLRVHAKMQLQCYSDISFATVRDAFIHGLFTANKAYLRGKIRAKQFNPERGALFVELIAKVSAVDNSHDMMAVVLQKLQARLGSQTYYTSSFSQIMQATVREFKVNLPNFLARLGGMPEASPMMPWRVQVLFSTKKEYSRASWSLAKAYDKSIHKAMLQLIDGATDTIYLETQYFISNSVTSNKIARALLTKITEKSRAKENFHVYLVLPMVPNDEPGGPVYVEPIRHLQWQSIRWLLAEIEKATKVSWSQYLTILFYGQWQGIRAEYKPTLSRYEKISSATRYPIYVHSKLIIADDNAAIIGSANTNDRSLSGRLDTESAIYIRPASGYQNTCQQTLRDFMLSLAKDYLGHNVYDLLQANPRWTLGHPSVVAQIQANAQANLQSFSHTEPGYRSEKETGLCIRFPIATERGRTDEISDGYDLIPDYDGSGETVADHHKWFPKREPLALRVTNALAWPAFY